MEIVFVVGLPLSLAKKAPGHAALAALMGYLMFNTFINAILTQWPHTFGANLKKRCRKHNRIKIDCRY